MLHLHAHFSENEDPISALLFFSNRLHKMRFLIGGREGRKETHVLILAQFLSSLVDFVHGR